MIINTTKQKLKDSPSSLSYNLLAKNPPMMILITKAITKKENHPMITFTINHTTFKMRAGLMPPSQSFFFAHNKVISRPGMNTINAEMTDAIAMASKTLSLIS